MSNKGCCSVVKSNACVYALLDPRTKIPFYVGIGKESRPSHHFKLADDRRHNSHKVNTIRKLRREGVLDKDMVVIIAQGLSAEVAQCTEEWLIAVWGRRSTKEGPLVNCTPGGERSPAIDPSVQDKLRKAWADPEARERRLAVMRTIDQSALQTEVNNRPGMRKRKSESVKKAKGTPEARAAISCKMREVRGTPEARRQQAKITKKLWADEQHRKKRLAALRRAAKDQAMQQRKRETLAVTNAKPQVKAKRSAAGKNGWSTLSTAASRKRLAGFRKANAERSRLAKERRV